MNHLNVAIIIVGALIISSAVLAYKVYGDDGFKNDCDNMNSGMPFICGGLHQLYNQNQMLIQEQNQTNKLLAYNACSSWNNGNLNNSEDYSDIPKCVERLLEKTK